MNFVSKVHCIVALILGCSALVFSAEKAEKATERIAIKRTQPIFFPVETLGQRRLFWLDTGLSRNAFDSRLQTRLHATDKVKITTAGGTATLQGCLTPEIRIGPIVVEGEGSSIVLDMTPFREASGIALDGIIGMAALRDYVLKFDFDNECLFWHEAIPEEPGDRVVTRLSKAGLLVIDLKCPESISEECAIDTGSDYELTLRGDVFDSLEKTGSIHRIRETRVQTGNGVLISKDGVLRSCLLNEWKHRDVVVSRGHTLSMVGLPYLSRYQMTIDFPNNQLFLKPGKEFAAKSRRNCLGIGIYQQLDVVKIKYVMANSPADEAGLKADDVIDMVNDKTVVGSELYELRRLFQEDGQKITLAIRRADRREQHAIQLRDF